MSGQPILGDNPITLPLLPLREVVVFPHMVKTLFVGRHKSVKALEAAMESGRRLMLVTQKAADSDEPNPEDLYSVGVVSSVLQMLTLPDGTLKVLVEGSQRARTTSVTDTGEHFMCEVTPIVSDGKTRPEIEALRRILAWQFDSYVKLNKTIPPEVLTVVSSIDDADCLADTVAGHLPLSLQEQQSVLGLSPIEERLERLLGLLRRELERLRAHERRLQRDKNAL
jgi:ATP-dependent Lon protease